MSTSGRTVTTSCTGQLQQGCSPLLTDCRGLDASLSPAQAVLKHRQSQHTQTAVLCCCLFCRRGTQLQQGASWQASRSCAAVPPAAQCPAAGRRTDLEGSEGQDAAAAPSCTVCATTCRQEVNKVQLQRTLTTLESSGTKTLQLHPLMLGGELVHQAEEAPQQQLGGAEGSSPPPTAQGTGRRWGACRSSLQLHMTAGGNGPEPEGHGALRRQGACLPTLQPHRLGWGPRRGACLVGGCSTAGTGGGSGSCSTAACRQTVWLHRASSAAACNSKALQGVTGSHSWV